MFALIESGRAQRHQGAWTGRALSLAIHATLITAAVTATKQVAQAVDPPLVVDTTLRWPTAPGRPAPTPCGICRLPGREFPVEVPQWLPDPGLVTPPVIPAPGPGAPADSAGLVLGVPSPGNLMSPGTLPLDARVVDEPPELLSHPEPVYPEVLRQAGIEGSVVIEAVLDTTGRAEPGSLRAVSAAQPLFEAEARQVVIGSRYRPARMAGRAVRVRVRIPIRFGIRR